MAKQSRKRKEIEGSNILDDQIKKIKEGLVKRIIFPTSDEDYIKQSVTKSGAFKEKIGYIVKENVGNC